MRDPTEPDTEPANEHAPRSSIVRALRLLEAFLPRGGVMSIRDLSNRTGVPKSSTHRLVREMIDWGALESVPGGVRLGVKLFELGALAPQATGIREAALPFAHHLSEVTGLTVNIAVRQELEIVYLEKISTRALHVPHSRFGGRGLLHATALGKAILAFSDDAVVDRVLQNEDLAALTPRTLTNPAALRRELSSVRAARIAYDVEESRRGLFCVAAPILDRQGAAVAAVSVTGATELSTAERFAPAVQMTGLAIARALNGAGE